MSLNFYKQETEKVCKSKGWDRAAVDTVWLLLTEEFGELASAIRQYKKTYKKTGLKKERGTDVMMEMGINPAGLSLKYGLFGAEPWSEGMRAEINDRLGIIATDIIGMGNIMSP